MPKKKKINEKKKKFGFELRKSFNTAIISAVGFLTALAWRDVITEFLNKIESISPLRGKFISAIIITIISAIVIWIILEIFPSEKK